MVFSWMTGESPKVWAILVEWCWDVPENFDFTRVGRNLHAPGETEDQNKRAENVAFSNLTGCLGLP